MERNKNLTGSEIHRLKPMREYDENLFLRMYNICKPVIYRLSKQIDAKRYDVTPDIIRDQFWDKFLYVFNKYQGTCEEEHLKARLLSSLATYKNHLLQYAYGEIAEYNQSLQQLEDLFDDSKELEDDSEEQEARNEMYKLLYEYMKKHLSSDALLVFEVITTPPPYIKERVRQGNRITNVMLLEFFGLERKKSSLTYIAELREEITFWEERAKEDLHY